MNRIRTARDYTALVGILILTPAGWVITTTAMLLCLAVAVYYTCVGIAFLFNKVVKLLDFTDSGAKPITSEDAPDNTMTLAQFAHTFIKPYFTRTVIKTVPNPVDQQLVKHANRLLDENIRYQSICENALRLAESYKMRCDSNEEVMELAVVTLSRLKAENEDLRETVEAQQEIINDAADAMIGVVSSSVDDEVSRVEIEQPVMEDTIPDVFIRGDKVKGKYDYKPATKSEAKSGTGLYKNVKGRWRPLSAKELNAIV